ncbi:MAG: alpha/beta fold hydrolase BchO [Pseudomonadota bacterium]
MRQSLNWERYGHDWPNREASRFIRASGIVWHVQIMGAGPPVLLLHGTGASVHSFAALMPLLASDFTLVAPDLPGQGFTQAPPREFLSLPGMARAIAGLLRELDIRPQLAVGHSAGAAVAIQMTVSRQIAPRAIVSLNGALLPLSGMAGQIFAPLAKLLTAIPFVSDLFARRAGDPTAIERMIEQTGSNLDERGKELYRRLASNPAHVAAALGMMAHWDLRSFAAELPRLKVPLTLVVGSNDRTIPPSQAEHVREIVPQAKIVTLPGLGHLAHEERPEQCAAIIRAVAQDAGLTAEAG